VKAKSAIPKWAVILIFVAIAIGTFLFWQRGKVKTSATTAAIPEKSIAVLPLRKSKPQIPTTPTLPMASRTRF